METSLVFLIRKSFSAESMFICSNEDQLDLYLKNNVSYITSENFNFSIWQIPSDKINYQPNTDPFESYLALLDFGTIVQDHTSVMEKLSSINPEVDLFYAVNSYGILGHHLTKLQADNLLKGKENILSIHPMVEYNKNNIQQHINNHKDAFYITNNNFMADNLKPTNEHSNLLMNDILKGISNGLVDVIHTNDIDFLGKLINDIKEDKFSLDNLKLIGTSVDKYIVDNNFMADMLHNTSLYTSQDYKVIKNNLLNELTHVYDLEVKLENEITIEKEQSRQIENQLNDTYPSYDPSDPDWMGAAEELKFQADQLGYTLQPGDLQDLEHLSKLLNSMQAGQKLGDQYIEVMEDLKYEALYDNYNQSKDKLNYVGVDIYPNGAVEILCTDNNFGNNARDFTDFLDVNLKSLNGLITSQEYSRDDKGIVNASKLLIHNSIKELDRPLQKHILYVLDKFNIDYTDTSLNTLKQIIEKEQVYNLKKKDNMENNQSSSEKFATQHVGSAIQFDKGTDKEHFRLILNKSDLEKCSTYTHTNKESGKESTVYNLSLKALKEPSGSATHVVLDSLYHKSNIEDKFVDVSVRIDKNKTLSAHDDKGIIPITVAKNDKSKERNFTPSDYRVYITQAKGEKVTNDAYIGYANSVNHQNTKMIEKTTNHRIVRDFIGSGFVDSNEKLPNGQALNVSSNRDKLLETVKDDQKYIYINFIPVKNNEQRLAAYVSHDKNDLAAQFTFRMETKEVKNLSANNEGYIKFSGYFDDKLENKNYNIIVKESLTKEQRDAGVIAKEIGLGADREHIKLWQSNDNSKTIDESKKQEANVENTTKPKVTKAVKEEKTNIKDVNVPSVDEIKGKKVGKNKGMEK